MVFIVSAIFVTSLVSKIGFGELLQTEFPGERLLSFLVIAGKCYIATIAARNFLIKFYALLWQHTASQ